MMKSALMLGLVLSLFAIPSAFAAESKCVGYSGPGGHVTQDRAEAFTQALVAVLILALEVEHTRVLEGPAVQLQARRIPIGGTGLIPTARNSRLSIAQLSRTSPNDPSCFSED